MFLCVAFLRLIVNKLFWEVLMKRSIAVDMDQVIADFFIENVVINY